MFKLQNTQLPIIRFSGETAGTPKTEPVNHPVLKEHIGHDMSFGSHYSKNSDSDFIFSKHDSFKQNSIYNFNKKTAKKINFCGFLSPEKGEQLLSKLNTTTANKAANKIKWFWKEAAKNQTAFDAMFALLITCGLRPAAIFAQANDKNMEKNKKAASHSIASGVIGYGFALAVFKPIQKGLEMMEKNPEKYAKKGFAWLSHNGTKLMKNSGRLESFKVLTNQGSQAIVAPVRSLITIAMIPVIDKYILNKIFKTKEPIKTKEDLKNDPQYRSSYINMSFKNTPAVQKLFPNFMGVMK